MKWRSALQPLLPMEKNFGGSAGTGASTAAAGRRSLISWISNLKKCQRGILMPQSNACDRLKADGPQWSTWKADFALVYVAPVNGLLKKAIERGVGCYAAGCSMNFCRKGLCSVIGVLEHLNISGLQSH